MKKITAADLIAKLNADPNFRKQQEEAEDQRKRRAAELRIAEAPLLEDLNKAGFSVESVWDLVNTATPYPRAVPILLDHISRPYPDSVREGIARALAVREARFAGDLLIMLYREERASQTKDGLAVAIAAIADEELIDSIIELTQDTHHGSSRLLLLRALEKSKNPRAKATIKKLAADPELEKEIAVILRRTKSKQ